MADVVELIPVSERDEAVFQAWESGKSVRAVAREFGHPVAEVERILDRCLPAFDPVHNLFAFKREIERLENLASEFYTIAKRDKDAEAAHLCARLNERIAAMRGWTAVHIKLDPMAAQMAERPKNYEKIREAILRLARPERFQSPLAANGNGDGAAPPALPDEGLPD